MSFNLRAHHLQAQTVRSRWGRAQRTYEILDDLVTTNGLPDRVTDALYTATLGFRLRRPVYVQQTGLDARTATRDLKALSDHGLLRPVGETKAGTTSRVPGSPRSAPHSARLPLPSTPTPS